jgi:hypothetical protein
VCSQIEVNITSFFWKKKQESRGAILNVYFIVQYTVVAAWSKTFVGISILPIIHESAAASFTIHLVQKVYRNYYTVLVKYIDYKDFIITVRNILGIYELYIQFSLPRIIYTEAVSKYFGICLHVWLDC